MHPSKPLTITLLLIATNSLFFQGTRASARADAKNGGVNIRINNYLETQELLLYHCRDKYHDYGAQQVPPQQRSEFVIHPGLPFEGADYYCRFVFQNTIHRFDIYLAQRDYPNCGYFGLCDWYIRVDGPCGGSAPDECYDWKS